MLKLDRSAYRDLHVTRFYSAFVAVSEGKVIKVTEPCLKYCVLANFLYDVMKQSKETDMEERKEAIRKASEEKISKFGFFTERREVIRRDIAIPYGASEMMMYALRNGVIDCAVSVCDGAGTVVSDNPDIVQGIGARMNGLFYTTPIRKVIEDLESHGSKVVLPDASIRQTDGLEAAAKMGFKRIAVTVNGFMNDSLRKIRKIEKDAGISAVSIVVCTTGVEKERITEIAENADLVWSCASDGIREEVGRRAILQVATAIPVFVLTKKGLDFLSGYSSDPGFITGLDVSRQYLIANKGTGRKIGMGDFETYLCEAALPVRSSKPAYTFFP